MERETLFDSNTYDPSEFDDSDAEFDSALNNQEQEQRQAVQVLSGLLQQRQTPPAVQVRQRVESGAVDEAYMLEVDKRLEVATCYRTLLSSPLFDDETEASAIVEREMMLFARQRLEILLSIRAKPAEPVVKDFSDRQIMALKMLADKVLGPRKESKPEAKAEPKQAEKPAEVPSRRASFPLKDAQPKITRRRSPTQPGQPTAPSPQPTRQATPAPTQQPAPAPAEPEFVEVVNPVTGQPGRIRRTRVQRPAGAVPMPTGNAMYMASVMAAQSQAEAVAKVANSGKSTDVQDF